MFTLADRIAQLSSNKRKLLAWRLKDETLKAVNHSEPKRLIAYVVLVKNKTPTTRELRTHLKRRLPSYMVPSAFVAMDALPLTPSGKVDRLALPPPLRTLSETDNVVAPATNSVERALAVIWTEVLGVERIGIEDNFFDLGGHSLSATQVMSRVRSVFGTEVPLLAIFEEPTIKGLAKQIDSSRYSKAFNFRSDENREEIEL